MNEIPTGSDEVFAAQKEIGDAITEIVSKHGISLYDVIAILEVIKHRTVVCAYGVGQ